MARSAEDEVRYIVAETERRKLIWEAMRPAAREAVAAVTKLARRHGVRDQNWLSGDVDGKRAVITLPTFWARTEARSGARHPRQDSHTLIVNGSGKLERPPATDTYQGYPDLCRSDIDAFRKAAVEQLIAALNAYLVRHQTKRRR